MEHRDMDKNTKPLYIGAIVILCILLFLMAENYCGALNKINELHEKHEAELEEKYQEGYEVGLEDGYAEGYDDGFVEAECIYDEN